MGTWRHINRQSKRQNSNGINITFLKIQSELNCLERKGNTGMSTAGIGHRSPGKAHWAEMHTEKAARAKAQGDCSLLASIQAS